MFNVKFFENRISNQPNQMNKFINPLDPDNECIKIMLENWIRKNLFLNDTSSVFVHEQACSEPSCLFAETIISVEQEEVAKTFIIAKPLTFVRERDIRTMREITNKHQSRHSH